MATEVSDGVQTQAEYELSEGEQKHREMLIQCMHDYGALFILDGFGERTKDTKGRIIPKDYVMLKGGRPFKQHLLDNMGRVWSAILKGSNKDQTRTGGGVPWRADHVEMWSGHWRKAEKPDGSEGYAKCIVAVSLDPQVNGKPGMTQISNYQINRGYRHPLDPPDEPTAQQVAMMAGERVAVDTAIWAKTEELAKKLPEDAKTAVLGAVQESTHAGSKPGIGSDGAAGQGAGESQAPEAPAKRKPGRPKGSRTNRAKSSA